MTFSYTVDTKSGFPQRDGHMWKSFGTFTNGTSDTGGDIDTGLSYVYHFSATIQGQSDATARSVGVNETFPLSGGVVTIVTTSGLDGTWEAIGKR